MFSLISSDQLRSSLNIGNEIARKEMSHVSATPWWQDSWEDVLGIPLSIVGHVYLGRRHGGLHVRIL